MVPTCSNGCALPLAVTLPQRTGFHEGILELGSGWGLAWFGRLKGKLLCFSTRCINTRTVDVHVHACGDKLLAH